MSIDLVYEVILQYVYLPALLILNIVTVVIIIKRIRANSKNNFFIGSDSLLVL